MASIGKGIRALTVAAGLTAGTGLCAGAAVASIRHQVAAAVGAALLTDGTGLVRRTTAAALDTLQTTTVMTTGTTVGAVGHQVHAPTVAAIVAVRTGSHGVAATAAGAAEALVRAVGGTGKATTTAVVEVCVRIDADTDVGAAGLAEAASGIVSRIAFAETESVGTHSAVGTAGTAVLVTAYPIGANLVFVARGVAPLCTAVAVASTGPKRHHNHEEAEISHVPSIL